MKKSWILQAQKEQEPCLMSFWTASVFGRNEFGMQCCWLSFILHNHKYYWLCTFLSQSLLITSWDKSFYSNYSFQDFLVVYAICIIMSHVVLYFNESHEFYVLIVLLFTGSGHCHQHIGRNI